MTASRVRLLGLEVGILLRQPLSWCVLGLLLASMLIAAHQGADRVARQRQVLDQVADQQMRAIRSTQAAAIRYSKPATFKVEYHRDPTDAFGYMNYFLVVHALKPPTPLGLLAAGDSALWPSQIRIDFTSIFPDAAYDANNPRVMKWGSLDLAFVIICLVPLCVIALAAPRLSAEYDNGILRMIAAQPIASVDVAFAKYGALAIVLVTAVVGSFMVAVVAAGGDPEWWDVLVVIAAVLGLWVMFWIAICALVASFWKGAARAVTALVCLWFSIVLLVPSLGALAIDSATPTPSRIDYIDQSRQAMDAFYEDESSVYERWLGQRPQHVSTGSNMIKSPEVKRFARDAYYRQRLEPVRTEFDRHQREIAGRYDLLRWLSPALIIDDALRTISGTDATRHRGFIADADAYSQRLRRYFEPLALANAARPGRRCPDCPGRLNFLNYDDVPKYAAVIDKAPAVHRSWLAFSYLGVLTMAVAAIAGFRLRTWPA